MRHISSNAKVYKSNVRIKIILIVRHNPLNKILGKYRFFCDELLIYPFIGVKVNLKFLSDLQKMSQVKKENMFRKKKG